MTHIIDGEQASARLAALLDDLRARATIPVGTRGRIYTIIDALRSSDAPATRIETAQRIALTVHGLEWARLQKGSEQEELLWRQLAALAAEWTGDSGASAIRRIEL